MIEVIFNSDAKSRIDQFLASTLVEFSRNKLQSMIRNYNVIVNGTIVEDSNYVLKKGDTIIVDESMSREFISIEPDASVPFEVLYEDNDVIVVNKPAGVVVHPGAGNYQGTLVHGLLHHCGNQLSKGSHSLRPGIVHRIDKDTSGVIVAAKNDFAHACLTQQFSEHTINRRYICYCYSSLKSPTGIITTQVGRDFRNRRRMAVLEQGGKTAITMYKTLLKFENFATKVECELKTGRTHQIRLHLSNLGNSLIGDSLYKIKNYAIPSAIQDFIKNFGRQALHAYFLEFEHPVTKERLRFEISMPDDMKNLEIMLSSCMRV